MTTSLAEEFSDPAAVEMQHSSRLVAPPSIGRETLHGSRLRDGLSHCSEQRGPRGSRPRFLCLSSRRAQRDVFHGTADREGSSGYSDCLRNWSFGFSSYGHGSLFVNNLADEVQWYLRGCGTLRTWRQVLRESRIEPRGRRVCQNLFLSPCFIGFRGWFLLWDMFVLQIHKRIQQDRKRLLQRLFNGRSGIQPGSSRG